MLNDHSFDKVKICDSKLEHYGNFQLDYKFEFEMNHEICMT